ncbi:helix-turn-helix domain-containing protein [Catellatospora sp. NPDC049609]|uniref:helix-turn-helix transcriptional regulator n=1 Tax=Catellatospora sp. NPDC049609 TaxID=3155505 RepID=UPI00342EF3C3
MTFGALAVPSRRRVLDALRAAGTPRDAVALGQATGLHPNTVRFHLRVLIEAGYVAESRQSGGGRGRPQAVYACVTPATGEGGYALLAELLASRLDDARGAELARSAGERWLRGPVAATEPPTESPGTALAGESASSAPVAEPAGTAPEVDSAGSARTAAAATLPPPGSLDEAAARATALFTELGFDPARTPDPGAARIELRACPFLDLARRHPAVVCGVHLGLLRGTLAGGAAGSADRQAESGVVDEVTEGGPAGAFEAELFPFARPGVCVAEIRLAAAARGAVR